MILMRVASQGRLHPQSFPAEHLKKFKEYRKRRIEIFSEIRAREPLTRSEGFSENCRQAIYFADKVYCCVLKEVVNGVLCKGCPCFEREPLEYSLFRRE